MSPSTHDNGWRKPAGEPENIDKCKIWKTSAKSESQEKPVGLVYTMEDAKEPGVNNNGEQIWKTEETTVPDVNNRQSQKGSQ